MVTARTGATATYIEEADELRRRFAHYRNAGPTHPSNKRINALLKQLLADGGHASITIATSATLDINGVPSALDLTKKACRLLAENAALVKATLDGVDRIEKRQAAPLRVRPACLAAEPSCVASRTTNTAIAISARQ